MLTVKKNLGKNLQKRMAHEMNIETKNHLFKKFNSNPTTEKNYMSIKGKIFYR